MAMDPATRLRHMRAIRKKDAKPELLVRSLLHRVGYRYRLHDKRLPGTPDIVLPSRRKAIFINGCFWHGHDCALGVRQPQANRAYWGPKIERNRTRDRAVREALEALGWSVEVIWECETRQEQALLSRLRAFLGPTRKEAPAEQGR